jgi:single-stranded DNA-binding protein
MIYISLREECGGQMVENILENNVVTISGKIVSGAEYSHDVYGESFYSFAVDVPRLSKSSDKLVITISERLINKEDLEVGKHVEINGQFRSYNNYNNKGSKLLLTIFARDIIFLDDESTNTNANVNQIFLNGFICKKPIYRTTPFGREISDILLAVNRHYNKSDYIPCITWGRNARYCESLTVGDNIKIWGRIQSREYQKKFESGEVLNRMAYEVSISKMEVLEKKKEDEEEPKNEEEPENEGETFDELEKSEE